MPGVTNRSDGPVENPTIHRICNAEGADFFLTGFSCAEYKVD
jgi:hypothetical protein